MMKYFLLCLAFAATVRAGDEWELLETEDTFQPRFLDSLFNSSTTSLPDYRAFLAFGLVLVLLMTGILGESPFSLPFKRNSEYADYDYGNYNQYGQNTLYARRGEGYGEDVATKMQQLEMAFKKFNVQSEECKMYYACEAAQLHKVKHAHPLVQTVNQIFSGSGDDKVSQEMERINSAFLMGLEAYRQQNLNPCSLHKMSCQAAYNRQQ